MLSPENPTKVGGSISYSEELENFEDSLVLKKEIEAKCDKAKENRLQNPLTKKVEESRNRF